MGKIISILFFLSGVTGLVYEVLWAKYLSLILGNTTLANTIVLSTFLGGLAIGNTFIGIWADKIKNQLELYGWLELSIGILGAISPILLSLLSDTYISLARDNLLSPLILLFIRISLCATIILIPAILMGGTLPCLIRFTALSVNQVERAVSWFYFLNSAGAVIGALLAGFYLISSFGLDLSINFAAIINVLIGLAAFKISNSVYRDDSSHFVDKVGQSSTISPTSAQRQIIIISVFISGFVSLTYEIAWIRLLSLILGSSTYSFSLMLSAFIAGITFGSLIIYYRLLPSIDSYLLFGLAELGIAISIIFTLPVYESLPYYFTVLSGSIKHTLSNYYFYETLKFFFCFFLMLIPTTFLGMTLPLACRVIAGNEKRIGEKVGNVYSSNILGNALGAVMAGIILLPLLGIKGVIEFGIALNLLIGSIVVWTSLKWEFRKKALIIGGCFGIFVIFVSFTSSWNKIILSSGGYRNRTTLKFKNYAEYKEAFKEQSLLYNKDDQNATVTVVRHKDGEIVLKTNGKADASSRTDLPTQALLAHIPLSLNQRAGNVLIIGLGSGITAGSALRYPVKKLDVVEISRGIVEAEKYFSPFNYNALEDPRLKLHVEDAKTFLQLTRENYDVIISEPSNPWIAGIGNLFSVEFYREASMRLNKGGVMAQWFHLYEMDDNSARLILRTFSSVFKHVTLWNSSAMDAMIIGSNEPLSIDFDLSEKMFGNIGIKEDLRRIDIENLTTLLSLQIASDNIVRKIAGQGRLNEDHFPILEYEAPKAYFLGSISRAIYHNDERKFPPKGNSLYLTKYYEKRNKPPTRDEFSGLLKFHQKFGLRRNYNQIMNRWLLDKK